MYDDGQDISLDGFYLRGETLGLLVGEQWESREVCAMFSPWGTWCWKKKNKTKQGSGTAAAEAVACPRSGQRKAAASQEPDGPFSWLAATTKKAPVCVRGGKYRRLKSLFAKTVGAFNVEERVKHAAWQGEGMSAGVRLESTNLAGGEI